MDPISVIAAGGQPSWEATHDHPTHGPLTFSVPHLPRARDWLAHSLAQDDLLTQLQPPPNPGEAPREINPRNATVMLASSIAGIRTLMKRPVVSESRIEDEDSPGHVIVRQELYDPAEDESTDYVMTVWLDFWTWRQKLLARVEEGELGKDYEETSTEGSDESSPADTASSSPILA